ncbi:SPW repeat protein [Planosporangium flavigriseum]|uniref:Membrane protein n=1 Tax=Planosporangium flavigriseum TaxID=373681 RepID=A0A8J3LJX6_9ACTN|nr:SPW repeat protein [Planosporangium flavigriseum]NJC65948.1 SPW repeat protein [Planosporangium flavigriseum]GIG74588.1 membrane protein [Planosporangium flavigriseum]
MVRPTVSIDDHPEIAELRDRFDRLAETPTAKSIDGLGLLSGLWLALSPWAVGFRPIAPSLTLNNLLCGITVAVLALAFAAAWGRTHGLSWVVPVIGAWTIVSPWLVQAVHGGRVDGGMIANNVITGLVILALGLAATTMARTRRGAGGPGGPGRR